MSYQCAVLDETFSHCLQWVEVQPSLLDQFSSMSLEEVGLLFSATAALFTVAWVFNRLGFFIRLKH